MLPLAPPRHRWLLLLPVIAMLAVFVAPAAPADASTNTRADEMRFVDSLNVERAQRGTARLVVAPDLTEVARRHSARMASSSNLHHNPNLSTQVSGWSRLAENVGYGGSVERVHRALMNSEGHRRNMLSRDFTEVGVGVAVRGSTVWVTQVFRQPRELSAASFRDVNGGSHASSIRRLYDAGITSGCTASAYCPSDSVTRAQMGTFIARSATLMPSSSEPFRDLHRAPMHRANISALAGAGITGGCDANNYCPQRQVTRAQMATMLANALDLDPVSRDRFGDVGTGNVHRGAINAIADEGITLGCATGRFCPDQPVSRAEMASFLVRAFDL